MRTIVDLPEKSVKALDLLGKEQDVSRAELVRRAVDDYLNNIAKRQSGEIVGPDIRGLVKSGDPQYWEGLAGQEWQNKMRGEWNDRDKLYENWGLLSAEEWQERLRRYNDGESIDHD